MLEDKGHENIKIDLFATNLLKFSHNSNKNKIERVAWTAELDGLEHMLDAIFRKKTYKKYPKNAKGQEK